MTGTIRLSRRELSLAATACSVQAAELDTLLTLPPPRSLRPAAAEAQCEIWRRDAETLRTVAWMCIEAMGGKGA